MLDVVEGIGKVVRGKVLADTAHRANGLPGWVQAFLDMLRRWVEEAGALMKLGAAVNEALHADADGARRLDEGFRGMVEELVAQDVEWLRGLQAEAGREAQGRVMAAGRSGVARVRGERPIMREAEAKQGEAVRREEEAREDYERAADEEVSAAMELAAGEQPGRVDAREMDLERGRELAGRFHAVEGGEAVVCRVEDGEYDGVREADIYAEDSKVARGALRRIVKALATEAVTFSDGTRATVSGRTRGEIQQHMADRRVIAALAKVRELAARGVYLYSAENSQSDVKASKQGIVGYHYYLAKGDFSAQGEAYVCIAVSEYADGQRVYDIDLTDVAEVEQNKEEAQLLPAGRISAQDVSGEKEEGNPRRATRVTNTGLAGTPFKGRIHETKKYVNYIDRVSRENNEGEVSGNSEQLGGESSMSVAQAREMGMMKDVVWEQDGDISMSVRNLAAVHTLSVEKFLAAGKMGGMPLPSVAVTRLDRPYRWGDDETSVTLVARPEMVDPEKGTQVYERDAWTGSIPQGAVEERNGRMVVNLGWGNYEEATPERLAELMEGRKRRGFEATSNWVDPKEAARAYLARRLRSMDEVKGMREKLSDEEERVVDDEEIEEWMESVSELGLTEQDWQSIFEALADLDEVTEESVREAIMRWEPEGDDFVELWDLKESDAMKEGSEFLQGAVRVISGLREEVRDYLEAVPQRAVGMDEWAYALFSDKVGNKEAVRRVCRENGIVPVEYNALGRDKALASLIDDGEVSFSVIGEHARTWGRYKERAFAGRDDGRMRAEIDASQARLTGRVAWGDDLARELEGDLARMYDIFHDDGKRDEVRAAIGHTEEATGEGLLKLAHRYGLLENVPVEETILADVARAVMAFNHKAAALELADAMRAAEGEGNEEAGDEGGEDLTLEDILDYQELYEAYPQLRSIKIELFDKAMSYDGAYAHGKGVISLFRRLRPEEVRSVLLHEVQHAIQGIEGFARGGNSETAKGIAERQHRELAERWTRLLKFREWFDLKDKALSILRDIARLEKDPRAIKKMGLYNELSPTLSMEEKAEKGKIILWNDYKAQVRRDRNSIPPEMEGRWMSYMLPEAIGSAEAMIEKVKALPSRRAAEPGIVPRRERELKEVERRLDPLEKMQQERLTPYEYYLRMAGEIEARNVQARKDMSAGERLERGFNETLEYPGEAIVDFSSSVSETLREDVRKAQERKLKAREVVRVSGCPPVLVRLGERDVDVVTTARVLYKLKNEHGLDVEDVMRVVNGMGEPVFVIRDTEGSYILFPGVMARNNNGEMGDVEVALGMERTADGEHFMLSAYALDSLQKVEQLLKGNGRLVYSRYSKAALSSSGVQGGGVSPDFIRLMVERGFDEDTIIGSGDVKGEFSGAVRLLRDGGEMGRVTRGLEEAGRSFKKNEAFVQQMLGEMRRGVERMRRLAGRGRTKREEALAVMGGMVGMVKAVRLYLPRGFGFSVEPYVRQLEVLCELATTGRVELADPIKRVEKELATDAAGEGLHADVEWFAQEWADGKVGDVMGRVMGRVAEQLRKYAKREVMLRMEDLLGRMEVKRKNGRLVGGKMDAEGYREMGKVREALGMSEEELEAKLSGLEARLGKAEDEEERGKLEGEMALYSTFGNGRGMSMEGAAAAYEALRVWVGMNRFSSHPSQEN